MFARQEMPDDPHVFASFAVMRERTAVAHKRLLLPFADAGKLEKTLDCALRMADDNHAELVLLRVCQRQPLAEREDIFSELKGIQARSQMRAVPVTIDTTVGTPAKSIARYVRAHDIDLVVLSEGDTRLQDTNEYIMQQISRRARCDSVLVD